ncbi:4'-phosphopantetheinyl transferase family protein [Fodinicola feengrottensis]|uniref:4'-phosphopantetheinyl transferase family protein n=1 Tax=Fodinicola feengrottensis TaxID=435914 RepID=UPI0013D329FF|nr:4'-phosphopantetheinyl transferase superfamily protein [Fodinicola feengrottensis]
MRRGFAATTGIRGGRRCAHRALAALGMDLSVIGSGPRREPLWPAGVVGSITHSDAYVAAAVAGGRAYAGLGIDVECRRPPLESMLETVCVPSEQAWCLAGDSPSQRLRLVFSAKESVFKAVYPATGDWLGFHDLELIFAGHTFTVHSGRWSGVTGAHQAVDDLQATAAWLPALCR